MPFIRQVQVRHVERHARTAIAQRLGYGAPDAVISVTRDPDLPGAVILHVNSGGNSLECERALRSAGYRVVLGCDAPNDRAPRTDCGVKIRVLPSVVGCIAA